MLKRREFLKHSVVVATAASTGVLTANTALASAKPIRFVIVDEEIEDSIAFADRLVARGARSFSVQADLGRLWFGELGASFAVGHSIAGLTTHTELMICREFARARGARVVHEASHDCRGGDFLTHSLHVGSNTSNTLALLESADGRWPETLASHLATTTTDDSTRCTASCRSRARRSTSNPGSLFSWVIA